MSGKAASVDWNATTGDVIFAVRRVLGPGADVDFSALPANAKGPEKALGVVAKRVAARGHFLVEIESGGDNLVLTLVADEGAAKEIAKALLGLGHRSKIR